MNRLLWWLLAGTRGGINRARIIMSLNEKPDNANQLAETLRLDYKTVRHHLDILLKHGVIVTQGDGYGRMFFLSSEMESDYDEFNRIWARIGKRALNEG